MACLMPLQLWKSRRGGKMLRDDLLKHLRELPKDEQQKAIDEILQALAIIFEEIHRATVDNVSSLIREFWHRFPWN